MTTTETRPSAGATPLDGPIPGAVVVGVDGSHHARQALDWAVAHATREHRPLLLVHAVGSLGLEGTRWPGDHAPERSLAEVTRRGQGVLDGAAADVGRRSPRAQVHTFLGHDDPRRVLLDLSREAEMVVVGSRGRGPIASLLLGSVSVAVSAHAHAPVVVLRPHHPGTVRRGVIVGVEGTSRSRHTLEFAYRYAAVHELPLTVLHSHADLLGATGGVLVSATPREIEDEERLLAELVAGMAEKYPDVPLELKVTPGVPAEKLVRAAAKHHLVVVGRHGEAEHGPTYLGGTSRAVVERAEAPVAVVPE